MRASDRVRDEPDTVSETSLAPDMSGRGGSSAAFGRGRELDDEGRALAGFDSTQIRPSILRTSSRQM